MSVLLDNKTCYSLLESSIRVEQLIEFAKNQNMKAIGICDFNCLFAAMSFYKAARKNNIKPIIGIEVKVSIDEGEFPYQIYPKNNAGYSKLMSLSCQLSQNRISLDEGVIEDLSSDCFIVICPDGYLLSLYSSKQNQKAEKYLQKLNENYFVALASHKTPFNRSYNQFIRECLTDSKVRPIALKRALYVNKGDYESYRTLKAIKYNTTVTDTRLILEDDAGLLTTYEFEELFDKDSLDNTEYFADAIDLQIDSYKAQLPQFKCDEKLTNQQYLRELCLVGLNKRCNGRVSANYRKRLDYELDVICRMGFQQYFLIIYDVIVYARKQGIYVGPGRGSAVGSLVAYCLGITHLDPLEYGLLFERFLNPERISMPDIDLDIPDDAREQLIEYVREKYGTECVGHIITFGTFAARAALRDAARTNNIPPSISDRMLRMLPSTSDDTLENYYLKNRQMKMFVDSYDDARKLFRIACSIEGLPRNASTHASGIVIADKPLQQVVPVSDIGDTLTTQYTMEYLEELGLIKFDFLGLRNLTIIEEIYHDLYPEGNVMDILKLPLDDKPTYQLLERADTNGIFQLEKASLKSTCKKIKPRCFTDIAVVLAIGRPGPSQYIDRYLANKANPDKIQYLHPDFKPILQETYGIIIYQEQIMQIAVRIAGFSLGKADILRKAISKKDAGLLGSLKEDFIKGALRKGYSELIARETYEMILKFADYGFNKSHAVGYSLIAYQQAYLKANFPLQFFKAQLNSSIGNVEKVSAYILECKRRGITVLPVDINSSEDEFTLNEDKLRYPLTGIKNVSGLMVKAVINDRQQNGPFLDYCETYARLHKIDKSDKLITNLIYAGALDQLGYSHTTMLESMDICSHYARLCEIDNNQQMHFDFNLVDKPLLVKYADDPKDNLNQQYEALGFYLTSHPVEHLRQHFTKAAYSSVLANYKGRIALLGMIIAVKEHRTKKGEMMCFITATDEMGDYEISVMPDLYAQMKEHLKKGVCFYLEGEKSNFDSVKANKITIVRG